VRPRFDLIVITDGQPELVPRLERLAPGLNERVAILLRDKQAPQEELLRQGRAVRALTHSRGAALLISGDLEVALACEADGVQLPEPGGELPDRHERAGISLMAARKQLGAARLLGVSRHDLAGLRTAADAGADYATLSPIFASPGKGSPLGVEAFARAVRESALPLFALGGVRAEDVPALRAAGATGVAVVREVLSQPNPNTALDALMRALRAAGSS
jgi:thiamine-phosphate pyrophosphorylase